MSDLQEVGEAKKLLRREVRGWLAQLTSDEVLQRSGQIGAKVSGRLSRAGVRRVAAFAAMATEPDLAVVWSLGVEVAIPKVAGEQLTFWRVPGRDCLVPGYRGILEPDESRCERVEIGSLDVILVPGLAFSAANGLRLGRGGGYYDRLLSGTVAPRWGICFEEQIRETIPGGELDARMDVLITCQRELVVAKDKKQEKKA